MGEKSYKAALLVIGDEILSGRTQDQNIQHLAQWLGMRGVDLAEVRIVGDLEEEIIAAVRALAKRYDYLFTTGGIGPTHDDITAACIAKAFGRDFGPHEEAFALLREYYGEEGFTPARQRMAYMPAGAELIANPVSLAPGFCVENCYTLAGVPKVMQAMLGDLENRISRGVPVVSHTITIYAPESVIAKDLGDIQTEFDGVSIGSYPFYGVITADGQTRGGAQIVMRSRSQDSLDAARAAVEAWCARENYQTDIKA